MAVDTATPEPDIVAVARGHWLEHNGSALVVQMEAYSTIIRTREVFVRLADEQLEAVELGFGDYDILNSVAVQSHPIPLSRIRQLARRYFSHQTSITNVVSRLTDRGLLATTQDPGDGRVTLVSLTRTGSRRLQRAHELLAEVQFGFDALTTRQRHKVTKTMVKIRAAHNDPTLVPVDAIAKGREWWEQTIGPPEAAAAMETASQLVRVREILVHESDELLTDLHLPFNDYDILGVIAVADEGGMPLSRIGSMSRRLFNHQTSITNVVTRLAERKVVVTRRDDKDRRVTLAAITDAGIAVLTEANSRMTATSFGLGEIDPSELVQLTKLLNIVRRARGDIAD